MTSPLIKTPRPLAPNDLLEATVRDYTRTAQRWGQTVDPTAVRRQAERDLVIVDAYEREVVRIPKKKAPRKAPAAPRADELDRAVSALGPRRVTKRRGKMVRDRALHQRAFGYAGTVWWWPHAIARVKRILEGAKGASLIVGVQAAQAPELALEFTRHWAALIQRRPWADQCSMRPYDGLNDADAERKFVSVVEGICERSKSVLGVWRHT